MRLTISVSGVGTEPFQSGWYVIKHIETIMLIVNLVWTCNIWVCVCIKPSMMSLYRVFVSWWTTANSTDHKDNWMMLSGVWPELSDDYFVQRGAVVLIMFQQKLMKQDALGIDRRSCVPQPCPSLTRLHILCTLKNMTYMLHVWFVSSLSHYTHYMSPDMLIVNKHHYKLLILTVSVYITYPYVCCSKHPSHSSAIVEVVVGSSRQHRTDWGARVSSTLWSGPPEGFHDLPEPEEELAAATTLGAPGQSTAEVTLGSRVGGASGGVASQLLNVGNKTCT